MNQNQGKYVQLNRWPSIEETRLQLHVPNDPIEPFHGLTTWLGARYNFEGADSSLLYTSQYGYSQRVILSYSVRPSQVPIESELQEQVTQFLFNLDNPDVDAYIQVGTQLILIIMYMKVDPNDIKEAQTTPN